MKAIIYEQYGSYDVLKYSDVKEPIIADDEVKVKVYATSLNRSDEYMLKGSPFLIRFINGPFKPKNQILGYDLSGIVTQVGNDVKTFKVGDVVFGHSTNGSLAEYTKVKASNLVLKPDNITHQEAAASVQAGITALQGIKKANVKKQQSVAVNGGSGGVGMFAVQIAKAYDTEVTSTCSQRTMAFVKEKGADHVVDYQQMDFTDTGITYDVILGINGYHPLKHYKRALKEKGTYMMVGGTGKQLFEGMALVKLYDSKKGKRMMALGESKVNQTDLQELKSLLENNQIKPHIDRIYTLDQTKEAFKYLIEEHAIGKVVITICDI